MERKREELCAVADGLCRGNVKLLKSGVILIAFIFEWGSGCGWSDAGAAFARRRLHSDWQVVSALSANEHY